MTPEMTSDRNEKKPQSSPRPVTSRTMLTLGLAADHARDTADASVSETPSELFFSIGQRCVILNLTPSDPKIAATFVISVFATGYSCYCTT